MSDGNDASEATTTENNTENEKTETKTLICVVKPEELKEDHSKIIDLLDQFEAEGSEDEWKEVVSNDDFALLHALSSIFDSIPLDNGMYPKVTHVFFMMISLDAPTFCPIVAQEYKIISKTIFANNEIQYYYRDKEHKDTFGPLTKEQLKAACEAKKLDTSSFVWHDKLNGWTKISEIADLNSYLNAPAPPPSLHRRVSKAQNLIVAKFDETLIQRLTILYTILKNTELASLTFEEGEVGKVMSEHLQLMANPNQEIIMLAAECLFLLDQIEGEKNHLRERASVHPNAPHFKRTLLSLLDRDDKDPVLVPTLEFTEQVYKHGPTKGREAFFKLNDCNAIMNSLWAHLKLSEHDPVIIQCLLCCDAMIVCQDYPEASYSQRPEEIIQLCNKFLTAHEGDQLLQDLVQSVLVKAKALETQVQEKKQREAQEQARKKVADYAKAAIEKQGGGGESKGEDDEKKIKLKKKKSFSEDDQKKLQEIDKRRDSMFSGAGGDGKSDLKIPFVTIDLFQLQTYESNPDSMNINGGLLIEKHKTLSQMMQTEGTEDEWRRTIQSRNFELLHTIALILTNIELEDGDACSMIETLIGLLSLVPEGGSAFIAALPNFFPKFIQTIKLDLEDASLLLRLRLVSTILLNCTAKDLKFSSWEDFLLTLLDCLSNSQEDIFGLIVATLLLVNAIDLDKKLLITKGLDHTNKRELSEAVPLVVNKGENEKVEVAAVNFVEQVFRCGRGDFFYTNDIFVLIDILTRLIKDANSHSPLLHYLNCYGSLVLWSEYPNYRYKSNMITETLTELLENTKEAEQTATTEAIAEKTNEILTSFTRIK